MMWQRRNLALQEITARSDLSNEITPSYEAGDGTLMRTLIDIGSETSVIAQDFVTDRKLQMEPVTTSAEDGCLEVTMCGNTRVYALHYVGVCIRSLQGKDLTRYQRKGGHHSRSRHTV